MKLVKGMFYGVGTSKTWIGLGFVPNKVRLAVIDQADAEEIFWQEDMLRAATGAEGILRAGVGNTPGFALLTLGTGVQPYYGGDVVPAANTHYLVHKSCLKAVRTDSPNINYAGDMRNMPGGTGLISTWTLQTAGSYTGKFDQGVDTSYVGVGSPVFIRPFYGTQFGPVIVAYVTAITNDGNADDEITLSQAVPSGQVTFIGYKYDFIAAPAGMSMPAGVLVNDYTYLNVASQKNIIEAWGE